MHYLTVMYDIREQFRSLRQLKSPVPYIASSRTVERLPLNETLCRGSKAADENKLEHVVLTLE